LNLEALVAGARDFDRRFGPAAPRAALEPAPAPAQDELFPLFAGAPAGAPAAEPLGPPAVDDPEAGGLEGFLQQVALLSAAEQVETDDAKASLMTVHSAKGLEFDTVFVIGLEEGLFPHSRALEAGDGLEEERRLAYVAITRAKRRLTLTRANWRTLQGRSTPQRASLFLLEVPPEVFEAGRAPSEVERGWATYADEEAEEGEGWGDPSWDDLGVDEPGGDDAPARP